MFDAFSRLMYERGYDAITLADIAEAAGMARTSMYNYYPTKEALLVSYTDSEMDRFVDELRADLAEADGAEERLRLYVRRQLEYFATHHLERVRVAHEAVHAFMHNTAIFHDLHATRVA